MTHLPAKSISDAELKDVMAMVARGRAIPAVIVAAIVERLEEAELQTPLAAAA